MNYKKIPKNSKTVVIEGGVMENTSLIITGM